jgi:hypothetical protein
VRLYCIFEKLGEKNGRSLQLDSYLRASRSHIDTTLRATAFAYLTIETDHSNFQIVKTVIINFAAVRVTSVSQDLTHGSFHSAETLRARPRKIPVDVPPLSKSYAITFLDSPCVTDAYTHSTPLLGGRLSIVRIKPPSVLHRYST